MLRISCFSLFCGTDIVVPNGKLVKNRLNIVSEGPKQGDCAPWTNKHTRFQKREPAVSPSLVQVMLPIYLAICLILIIGVVKIRVWEFDAKVAISNEVTMTTCDVVTTRTHRPISITWMWECFIWPLNLLN